MIQPYPSLVTRQLPQFPLDARAMAPQDADDGRLVRAFKSVMRDLGFMKDPAEAMAADEHMRQSVLAFQQQTAGLTPNGKADGKTRRAARHAAARKKGKSGAAAKLATLPKNAPVTTSSWPAASGVAALGSGIGTGGHPVGAFGNPYGATYSPSFGSPYGGQLGMPGMTGADFGAMAIAPRATQPPQVNLSNQKAVANGPGTAAGAPLNQRVSNDNAYAAGGSNVTNSPYGMPYGGGAGWGNDYGHGATGTIAAPAGAPSMIQGLLGRF